MAHRVGHLKYSLLGEQTLDLIPVYNISLLERLDGKVLCCGLVLSEDDFTEVSAAKHRYEAELVEAHRTVLRVAVRLVCRVAVTRARHPASGAGRLLHAARKRMLEGIVGGDAGVENRSVAIHLQGKEETVIGGRMRSDIVRASVLVGGFRNVLHITEAHN